MGYMKMTCQGENSLCPKKCEEQESIAEKRKQSQVCDGAFARLSHFIHECMDRTAERECHETVA